MWMGSDYYGDATWFDRSFSYFHQQWRRLARRRPGTLWPVLFFASGSLLSGFGILFLFQMLLTPVAELGALLAQSGSALLAFGAGQHFLRLQRRLRGPAPQPVAAARAPRAVSGRAVSSPPVSPPSIPERASPRPAITPEIRDCLRTLRTAGVNVTIAKALVRGGFCTAADLRAATDEQLLAVHGVGPATLRKVRTYFRED
jgi:hypothetical protein